MTRRVLKEMTDAECIEAYRLNQAGEGCAMISGYGDRCSYQTANAMIDRGGRLLKARADALAQQERIIAEAAARRAAREFMR